MVIAHSASCRPNRLMLHPVSDQPQRPRGLPRWLRGSLCTVVVPVAWVGRQFGWFLKRFRTPERYDRGLVIVLPGIESESFLNHGIVWGLSDGGWPGAIEIYDWTTTCVLLFVYHLRAWKRNLRQAQQIAQRIVDYQEEFPGRPVHVIGHSGGGALAILTLEALPADRRVTSAILLAPALSTRYSLTTALQRTERGVWNFWSPLDVIFCGAGTLLLGTIDGRLQPSSGMIGFRDPAGLSDADREIYHEKLHQQAYSPRMAHTFNLGGHFGCVNRVFVEERIAPLLR